MVYGHQIIHLRHNVQSFLVMISSRVVVMLHVLPSNALVGHTFTQILQVPHFGFFGISLTVIKGALVNTLPSISAQPYSLVTNRLFLPIKPNPALNATVLCGRRPYFNLALLLYPSVSNQSANFTDKASILCSMLKTSLRFGSRPALINCPL